MSAVLNIWGLPGGASIHSNLIYYGWNVSNSLFGRYNPHVRRDHVSIRRNPDKNSNLLIQLCANGTNIDLIKVTMTYTDEDGYPSKGSIYFSDNVISTIQQLGGAKPVESITFSFESFTQEY